MTKIYSVGPDNATPEDMLKPDTEWLVYWYEQGSYEGSGSAYCKIKDGRYYHVSLGHCSCYGPFDVSDHVWDLITEKELFEMYLVGTDEESVTIRNKILEINLMGEAYWLSNLILSKDERYRALLEEAYIYAAKNSIDPSTQTGALIVKSLEALPIVISANCPPNGVTCTCDQLHDRNTKLLMVEHAERGAILKAAKNGLITDGTIMVAPWYACADCARAIIAAGIKTVIGHKATFDKTPDRWKDSIKVAFDMFKQAGVECIAYDGKVSSKVKILFNGESWEP